MCPYEGNLPPEYELMHQFTMYQVGKRSKICQTHITFNLDKVQLNMSIQRQLPSWEKEQNNLSLTTLNPDKVQSNVSVQRQLTFWVWVNAPVHSVPSCEKEQNMSNNLLLTTLNPDKVQSNVSVRQLTNWVWVNTQVHSVPSWEKEQTTYHSQHLILTRCSKMCPNLVYYKSLNLWFCFARACFTSQVCCTV